MGQYPWVEILLLEVLHAATLYPTRQHTYRVAIIAAVICVTARFYLILEVTVPLAVGYTAGCAIAFHFMFMTYILFAEGPFPDHWRRVRDEPHAKADASGLNTQPSNFPSVKKLWWTVDIAYSVRMVGWVQEPRDCLPSHPPPSRRMFLQKTSLKLIINVFIIDFTTSLFALNPAFDHRVHDPTDGPETYLAAVPLLRRVPYVLSYGIMVRAGIVAAHNVVALVCVCLGQSSPTLWPDMWGHWGDAYTVRKLWGRTWHQQARPAFGGLGRLVANKLLKFPRGSNRSSYTQLYIAFFLSGLFHSSGDFMLEKRIVYRSFKFFLLQAVAITFEDLVIYTAKHLLRRGGIEFKSERAGEAWAGKIVRVIGYFWVTLWFCATLPVWIDESSAIGFASTDRGAITQFLLDMWKRYRA